MVPLLIGCLAGIGLFALILVHHSVTGGSFLAIPIVWVSAISVGLSWDILELSLMAALIATVIFSIPYMVGGAAILLSYLGNKHNTFEEKEFGRGIDDL